MSLLCRGAYLFESPQSEAPKFGNPPNKDDLAPTDYWPLKFLVGGRALRSDQRLKFWGGETLKEFHFRAPTLFDASAKVPVEDQLQVHDDVGTGAVEHLAKIKKFALWLKSEMVDKGLAANGPYLDTSGWMIDVPSNGGPFVLCTVSGSPGDESLFELLVVEIGGAPKDVGDVIGHILRNASQIAELRVD
jgi:hypothetical protein